MIFFRLILYSGIFFWMSINTIAIAQMDAVDSANLIVKKGNEDSITVQAYFVLANDCYFSDPDAAIDFCERARKLSEKIKYKNGKAESYAWLGYLYYNQGEIQKALDYEYRGLKIREELGNKEGIATSYNNIGYIYQNQGDYQNALKHYELSLNIRIEIDSKYGIAESYNNIGAIYGRMGSHDKALEYYFLSLDIQEEIGDSAGIAISLVNIGNFYYRQGDPDCTSSDSTVCLQRGELKALEYFEKSLKMQSDIGDKRTISTIYMNTGSIYLKQGKIDLAYDFAIKSMDLAEEIGFPNAIRGASFLLYQIYKEKRQFDKALEMYETHILMRDSITNDANQKAAIQTQLQFEYDKKAAADSVRVVEQQKVSDAKFREEKTKRNALFGGLILVLIFAGLIFNRFKITKKQNHVIAHQKELVEEKQKEILDSITYAKRLQEAILPSRQALVENLKDGFVLFKPKDVVSGDFYWLEKYDDVVFFAAADCTGHGVPGAMVSVVCSNALSKALVEEGNTETGKLLDRTRLLVTDVFARSGENVNDGMDISICAIQFDADPESGAILHWSGANNPLWLIREEELIEYKPDKQPVGRYAHGNPFTTHRVELKRNDLIYISTDGYQDQFGGEKGKKIKAANLKEILLRGSQKSMNEQKENIEMYFEKWKGALEQVDDVCIIGVRI